MTLDVATLTDVVAVQLQVPTTNVTLDARFVEDLGAEPMLLTDLVLALEERFELDISTDEAESLRTLRDVIDYLDAHGHPADP